MTEFHYRFESRASTEAWSGVMWLSRYLHGLTGFGSAIDPMRWWVCEIAKRIQVLGGSPRST